MTVIKTYKGEGDPQSISLEDAIKELEPGYYKPGTINEMIDFAEDIAESNPVFTAKSKIVLQSMFATYEFVGL